MLHPLRRLQSKKIGHVRICGVHGAGRDRDRAHREFQELPEKKVCLVGLTAGGVGLDLSAAQASGGLQRGRFLARSVRGRAPSNTTHNKEP